MKMCKRGTKEWLKDCIKVDDSFSEIDLKQSYRESFFNLASTNGVYIVSLFKVA